MCFHRPLPLTLTLCIALALTACDPGSPPEDSNDGPPGSGQTYLPSGGVPETCDPETSFDMALLYAPVKADVQGDWTGWAGWPVTWIFDGSDVMRFDQIPQTCDDPNDCTSSEFGESYTVHGGTFKIQNALILIDWNGDSASDSLVLPDLLYVLKECTGKVWFMESNYTFGEVPFEKI